RAPAAGAASQPGTVALSGLSRGMFSFGHELERAIFNPQGMRAPMSPRLSSLDRELEPGEEVVVLQPARYHYEPCRYRGQESQAEPAACHGIEYLWEVLTTDQGVLVAVPVPVLESFGRAADTCECVTPSIPGRCTSTNYCNGTLPVDKHCMKTIDSVPDVDIVIKLCVPQKKTAAGLQGNVDFVVSYTVRHPGGEWWMAIWGVAKAQPVGNVGWAGTLVHGVGYFLEDTRDGAGVAGASSAAANVVNEVIAAQGLASKFEFGIKEKGIK
ncbi:MAG TPA: hypothetical protein VLT32_00140, partial [Candidatus Sulfomarinibacteraceae bacterium]|nr:hypothetical protein [Candidatus Sulfomarinibacteraceae bacterium]